MRSPKIFQNTVVVAFLFLLCTLVPQYAAAPNVQNGGHLQKKASSWDKPARYVSDGAAATFYKLEDAATNALNMPPWGKILAYGRELLKATDESLNAAALEFHVTEKVDDFRSTLQSIVSVSVEVREHMTELTAQGLTLDQISDELGIIFNDILNHLKKAFPPPDQAPSHEDRKEMVTSVLDGAEQGLLEFSRKHGMSEAGQERLRNSFDRLKPHVEKLVVITGDLIEQHPILFSALVFSATAMLIPESWILRPLLSLFGFGPSGPVKGSAAAFAQRLFWGATVKRGSWFAILQRAGMKGLSARPIMGAIGGAIGAVLPCFLARSFHPRIMFQG